MFSEDAPKSCLTPLYPETSTTTEPLQSPEHTPIRIFINNFSSTNAERLLDNLPETSHLSSKSWTDDHLGYAESVPFSVLPKRLLRTARGSFVFSERTASSLPINELLIEATNADWAIVIVDDNGPVGLLNRQLNSLSILGIKHLLLVIYSPLLASPEGLYDAKKIELLRIAKPLEFKSVQTLRLSDETTIPGNAALSSNDLLTWFGNINLPSTADEKTVFIIQQSTQASAGSKQHNGYLASGTLKIGDEIRVTRSGCKAIVTGLSSPQDDAFQANKNASLVLTLDTDIKIKTDDIISLAQYPLESTDQFQATIVWLSKEPGLIGRSYEIKLANQVCKVSITNLKYRINLDTLAHEAETKIEYGDVVACTLATTQSLVADAYENNKTLGRFVLKEHLTQRPLAVGMFKHSLRRADNVHAQALTVTSQDRSKLNGHTGKVIWFTGLSGSGKSTLANALEVALNRLGYHTYLLDGDNIRHGLNKDLGFTDADRVENIRRISEVAKLMLDAGLIVMTAFISPFAQERKMARELIGEESFIEVFVSTSLEVCEARDVKGLYKKARAGQLPNLTGVGSIYEPPLAADIDIDTTENSVDAGIEKILGQLFPTSRS
ncbi:adenylylsulfate kinase ApsK [Pseudomonas sp. GM50]|uniref:adenylyl-sulfate kinase n=1 Tax=Pseudomonas sp. GM50 TaxID=1144332 RepID=UPI00027090A6|nr:adenylyl-sulfate kinase [Pseudomonas sp. GM50]EJM65076.1 adenylylsulfate kinase ApsK [Pseudomonas sp. GM50]